MLDGSEHPSWLDNELELQLYQQPHLDKILTVFRSSTPSTSQPNVSHFWSESLSYAGKVRWRAVQRQRTRVMRGESSTFPVLRVEQAELWHCCQRMEHLEQSKKAQRSLRQSWIMIIEPMVTRTQVWRDKTGWEDTFPTRPLAEPTQFQEKSSS